MSAMSALRASETPSPANPSLADAIASLRTVQVPGTPATYANRAALKEMGLRWDPANHRWHGTTTAERVHELRERLGLEVRVFGQLETPPHPKGPAAPRPAGPWPVVAPIVVATRNQPRRPHDGSRTCLESRIAIPSLEEDDEVRTPSRRFTIHEITSGLPDDSREEDERREARRLRDQRGRVKVARALVSTTPGLAETLYNEWNRAARFYARFGITEAMLRSGVPTAGAEGMRFDES
jgi:hypothetical protein